MVDGCIGNCGSCDDEECPFHEKNYDEEKLVKLINEKLSNESSKNRKKNVEDK